MAPNERGRAPRERDTATTQSRSDGSEHAGAPRTRKNTTRAQRTAHHVVSTFLRGRSDDGQPGYAAYCETPGCGAITFGGFSTRQAAREALGGHGPESLPVVTDLAELSRDRGIEA